MKVLDNAGSVMVEESTLERLLLVLETKYPDVAFYSHDDGSKIDCVTGKGEERKVVTLEVME